MSTLNNAVNALHHAESFTKEVEGTPTSRFQKPSGQHANAPYKMAAPKPKSEVDDIASGLKWKAEQAKVANPQ
jgi:hypothetical protein